MSEDFNFPPGQRPPRRTILIDFVLTCMSRFIGNCFAIVVAFIIIFIGLHIYGYVVVDAVGRAWNKVSEVKAKK